MLETFEPFFRNHSPQKDELFDKIYEKYIDSVEIRTETALKVICASFVEVATRQLKDHLPGGPYQTPSEKTKQETKSVRKHNIVEKNDFGHCQKQKPNASTKHHSSTIMTKFSNCILFTSVADKFFIYSCYVYSSTFRKNSAKDK